MSETSSQETGRPRVALVTGGARGLGKAIVDRLAGDGVTVVVADRLPGVDEVVDLTSEEEITALATRLIERHGRIDILVNNAGRLGFDEFGSVDLATWRAYQAVNVEAPFLLTQALAPAMVEAGWGRIVNISSVTAWAPPPSSVPYVTTKGAIVGFTRALAVDLAGTGVTVNSVAPGMVLTEGAAPDTPPEMAEAVISQQRVRRQIVPEDVAGAVSYLVSENADIVTGQAIRVDGGYVTL